MKWCLLCWSMLLLHGFHGSCFLLHDLVFCFFLVFGFGFWNVCFVAAATENPFNSILRTLEKPGGAGEFGKYFSLPALNDPRIGESLVFIFWLEKMLKEALFNIVLFVCLCVLLIGVNWMLLFFNCIFLWCYCLCLVRSVAGFWGYTWIQVWCIL